MDWTGMLPQRFRLRRSRRSGRAAAERSRNAPGSAAWVAPFTFFTQKPAKHTRAQTVLDSLTVGVCTVRKPKALTACSHETVPLA